MFRFVVQGNIVKAVLCIAPLPPTATVLLAALRTDVVQGSNNTYNDTGQTDIGYLHRFNESLSQRTDALPPCWPISEPNVGCGSLQCRPTRNWRKSGLVFSEDTFHR